MSEGERNEFIGEHYGLVHSLSKRFIGRGIDYEDLFQAGSIGLIKAADAFDKSYNVCFSTYAVPVILGEIKRLFRDGGAVKVSRELKELSYKVNAVSEKIIRETGIEPKLSEIAAALSVSEEEVAEAISSAKAPVSLTLSNGEDETTLDIAVDESENLFNRIAMLEIKEYLNDKDWTLIGLRYLNGRTQSETARVMGMTQVQVSRRERTILNNLRRKFA